MVQDRLRLGSRIRSLRRSEGLSQAKMAERLGISASYLNLIEHNQRPLSAQVLLKLAQEFHLDLKTFAGGEDERLVADLLEVFGDRMFERLGLTQTDVREQVGQSPLVARAILNLYHAYQGARSSAEILSERLSEGQELKGVELSRLPSEEVSDLIQRHMNYFPDLEEGAERLWRDAGLEGKDLFQALAQYLEKERGVKVRIEKVGAMHGAIRRFEPGRSELLLSEVLRRGSRNFQLAHQVGLLELSEVLDRLAGDPLLLTGAARSLCRVAMANYFAGAVLMPYERFLKAAQEVRYDIDLLGHRFRTSLEQVCHRLTSLRRPRAEGVPFHFLRVDVAGNISKRFSASGIRIARFSGACPLWNVHAAFLTPGMIRVQLSRMPDGTTYFDVARTLPRESGGYHAQRAVHAIDIGCPVQFAGDLVYSDGVDLENPAAVPVGVTCRLCDRMNCEQRAFPAIQSPLVIDENVRGASFYASTSEE
ncbi:MAG TPA: short-chain fatty acyl-CoA regulator family protein [Candidatus Polarisedimenticolia bacterium]|nr:short-chain fatty acyl-CoA regulator family protein [Candidatus Polarisedimenticolia bacterium]